MAITGHELEIVVGHLVPVMSLSRWSLGFVCYAYRFIQRCWYEKQIHRPSPRKDCETFVEFCRSYEVLLCQMLCRMFPVLMFDKLVMR